MPLSATLAHYLDWTPSYYSTAIVTGYCTRTCYDTIGPRTIASWNSTRTANLHHMLSENSDFYTYDAKDLSGNLNATGGMYTDMEQPYYDMDDDDGNRKSEEAEITSEWQSFPAAGGHYYYSRVYFMHWWRSCSQCAWQWDPDGGTIQQVGQLSFRSCIICDKYDSDPDYNSKVYGNNVYSSLAQQSASAIAPEPEAMLRSWQEAEQALSGGEPAPASLARSMRIGVTSDPGERAIHPDLSRGLEAYRADATRLARAVAQGGPSLGVVTLSAPLAAVDLAELSGLGLEILSIEAVTEPYDAVRGTYIGPYSDSGWVQMGALANEFHTSFLGVTSLQVIVPNPEVLAAVSADPRVYLVDLSIEQVRRSSNRTDVVMNDLYWQLAGWS